MGTVCGVVGCAGLIVGVGNGGGVCVQASGHCSECCNQRSGIGGHCAGPHDKQNQLRAGTGRANASVVSRAYQVRFNLEYVSAVVDVFDTLTKHVAGL